jgi:serine/threonine protein kinase/Tol biopolymer transport system component
MALTTGTTLGPYEIQSSLGAGGMGEVYRARDTRLNRDVAVKILPPAFALDPERLRRFKAEAQAVAALNHPNILAIHDIGDFQSSQYIVMEFLDGHTLRERLLSGSLSVRKATDFAAQIARGLAAAHDKGIVHRDLKPENIFITHDGHLKILDFGLAKLVTPEATTPSSQASAPSSETFTRPAFTEPGMVMGTVGYMSPEQVRGQPADQRSDIFSFGAIFYEMLSGKRAFHGDSPVEVMSAILKEEPPPLTETPLSISPALDRIVHHCLEKNPAERFQSARDVAFNITGLSDTSSSHQASPASPLPAASKSRSTLALIAAAFLIAALAAAWFLWHPQPQSSVVKYDRVTFAVGSVGSAHFTPDGRTIIFDASWDGGPTRLYQWRAETPQAQSMDMEDVQVVAISKSNELAMLLHTGSTEKNSATLTTLARAPLSGGAPRELLENVRDAAWSPDEQLAAVHVVNGRDRLEFPIGKVLYETSGWINSPRFSRDGKTIAFLDHTAIPDSAGTVSIVDLNGKRQVLTSNWGDLRGLAWSPSGNEIWFGASDSNWDNIHAVDLDKHERLVLELPSEIELKDIAADGRVLIDSLDNRLPIKGRAAAGDRERDLSWFDVSILADISPDGKQILLGEENTPDPKGNYWVGTRSMDGSPIVHLGDGLGGRFSPDGKWVTAFNYVSSPPTISVIPLSAGVTKNVPLPGIDRLTGTNVGFFPDGKRIWFNAAEASRSSRAYAVDIAGGSPTPITPEGILADGISDDGKTIIASDPEGGISLYPIAGGPPRRIPGTLPVAIANNIQSQLQFVQWGPDSRTIYVRELGLPTTIYQMNLATGQKTVVLKLMPSDPAGVTSFVTVSLTRDGKSYAYGYRRVLSQLLIVDGLH